MSIIHKDAGIKLGRDEDNATDRHYFAGSTDFLGTTSVNSLLPVVVVTDTYTILANDSTIICNKATAFTVTLPSTVVGKEYYIKNIGAGDVTVDAVLNTIDGETSWDISQWSCLALRCYETNKWSIV